MQSFATIFSRYKILSLLFVIAVIWLLFGWLTDGYFLTPRNFSNLLRQMAITGMLAAGMVFVIISGEIDLSVGSLLGLLGGVAAILDVVYGFPVLATILTVLALGLMAGLFNGWWVAYRGVPSFMVGLAGLMAYRGVLLGITDGSTVAPVSPGLVLIGQAYLPRLAGDLLAGFVFLLVGVLIFRSRAKRRRYNLDVPPLWQDVLKLIGIGVVIAGFVIMLDEYRGIPIPVLVLGIVLGVFTLISRQTVFGRRVYSVGSNVEATRLSGVNVKVVKLAVFGLVGLMCAVAGLTTTARLAAGSVSAGNLGELDAIASCIIGGTSMRGGSGTVYGALIGALIMASLDNGMSMLGVETFWQMIVKGSILLLAVWVDIATSAKT
ncbi:sugar ABC transporter permease [Roseospira visakhapatnamensis]|uniref:Xylose transport system permease protein XylH n=1 Tax=Roseospira visakhapatnamensis TaxID=390880 RepID=A0A7W6RHG5_9PROT|nr:sugar ABC transporter permease [Roseospira visakhapatnamensis]MBB4267958.1 D-xylose transport system permease protein [Roseospira visakhapatnamensis]